MTDHPPVRQRLRPALAAVIIAILAVIVTAGGAYYSLNAANGLTDLRAAARNGRLQLERTLSVIKDLETGSRGYALTGRAEYREPFDAALASLPYAYAQLKDAVRGEHLDDFTWSELDALVASRQAAARRVVDERHARGAAVIGELALFNEGKQAMDGIRAQFALLDALQAARIDRLNEQLKTLRQRALILNAFAAVAAVSLILLAAVLVFRERRARLGLEAELRQANQMLEQRVAERTEDLDQARSRIAGFAGELDRTIEAERRHLAREVHEQIGQIFSAIKMIARGLPQGALPADQERVLFQAIDLGVSTVRQITAELRPPLFDDLGLEEALRHALSQRFPGEDVGEAVTLADQDELSEPQAIAIFRIVQEAGRHVKPEVAVQPIVIKGGRFERVYQLTIMIDVGSLRMPSGHLELHDLSGLRERAELLGATLSMDSSADRISVILYIPLANPEPGVR